MAKKTIKTYKNGVLVRETLAHPTPSQRATIQKTRKIADMDQAGELKPFPEHLQRKMQAEADAGIAETERILAKEKLIERANKKFIE